MQDFFIEKVKKISIDVPSLVKSLNLVNQPDIPHFSSNMTFFRPVEEACVKKLTLSSPFKTSSANFIPKILLVDYFEHLIRPITRLFDLSLKTGIFPDCLKPAHVTLLLKKSGLYVQILANCRPISYLNFIGKILERIVLEQLIEHFNNILKYNQLLSAYRKNHSTQTALVKITNDICSARL